jgi:ELWxxDGT repeat protein
MVLDIDPRPYEEEDERYLMLSNVGGRLIFWPFDSEFGAEPWTTDGTPEGTRMIQDIAPGALSSAADWEDAQAILVGSNVFFIADDRVHGREVWALPLDALGAGCTGDCDDNGVVSIDELLVGIDVSLGRSSADTCPAFDVDRRGDVTIDELILGVDSAIKGCS